MDEQKYIEKLNQIYTERMIVVRMLAVMSGCNYGLGRDDNEDWEDDWRNVVYIDLPQGQVSWHIAKENMHLFDGFPQYQGKWDGKFSGRDADFAKTVVKCNKNPQDCYRVKCHVPNKCSENNNVLPFYYGLIPYLWLKYIKKQNVHFIGWKG